MSNAVTRRRSVRMQSALCNANADEKNERHGAEPAADRSHRAWWPSRLPFDMALWDGHRHQSIIAMRQGRQDRVCTKCEQPPLTRTCHAA